MYELGANALHILGATHNSSSSSTSTSLIGTHHRPPSCHDMLSPSSVATTSSTSSTVSLSFPSATCAGGGACASPQHHEQELHYQKMICQLTISNSNLMHETEALKMKLTRMQSFLNDHIQHLNSVYYTLFCNGYSALHLPDGEQVHLSQFRGALLNFVGGQSASGERCLKRDHHTLKERTSDLSSDSSISSADADELKTAMLKCITRSKYDDIDEFVSWLSRDTTTTANAVSSNSSTPLDGCSSTIVNTCQMCHNNGLPTSSASSFRCPHQPQVKSRSLEDELERRLRISRSPLRRTSRIDQITTAYQQQQQRQQQQQQQQQQYWSSQQQKSSQQQHPQQNFLRASARALSESELRRPTSCATSLPINYAVETYSVPSVLPLQPQQQQQHGVQLNGGGSSVGQQLNVPTTSSTVNVTPNPAPPVSGSMSARTAKSKTARLRAQSVHSAKIGGILGGGVGSSRRSAMEKEKSAAAAAATRKSLTPMRSPILTLGRAPPPKAGRNLI